MAKRKKKESVTELLGALLVMIIIGSYLFADSIVLSALIGIAFFVITKIIIFSVKKERQKKINLSGILQIDKMTGIEFEKFLMVRYRSMGYTVKETPLTGDFGADLVLHKDSRKIVVQAKRYSKTVGLKAIQEANSAKPHYNADEAWVITNNYFTAAAKKLAATNNVKLIDRDQLIKILYENVLLIK